MLEANTDRIERNMPIPPELSTSPPPVATDLPPNPPPLPSLRYRYPVIIIRRQPVQIPNVTPTVYEEIRTEEELYLPEFEIEQLEDYVRLENEIREEEEDRRPIQYVEQRPYIDNFKINQKRTRIIFDYISLVEIIRDDQHPVETLREALNIFRSIFQIRGREDFIENIKKYHDTIDSVYYVLGPSLLNTSVDPLNNRNVDQAKQLDFLLFADFYYRFLQGLYTKYTGQPYPYRLMYRK